MLGSFRPRSAPVVRILSVLVAAGVSLALLSGCAAKTPTPTDTSVAQASETPTATAPTDSNPTPTPTPEPWTKVTLTCDGVLTPQQVYDFNPNVGADPAYTPSTEGNVATIVAGDGVACGLMNQSSNAKIEFAVGQPPESVMTDEKNSAITNSNFVPTYGVPEGYFLAKDGVGEAQAFQGSYWVVMRSTIFTEPGDAERLMKAVLGNLAKS